jgi:ATP-dependent DNA ligase
LFDAALQLEGIVAKREDSPYRAGRSRNWIKIRTPHGQHVQEQRSEQWGG